MEATEGNAGDGEAVLFGKIPLGRAKLGSPAALAVQSRREHN